MGILNSHLVELDKHADEQLAALANCAPPKCALAHHTRAVNHVKMTKNVIRAIMNDPDINDPALAGNFYIDAKSAGERLRILEEGLVLVLTRFSKEDERLTRLLQLITSELNWPFGQLLGSTISSFSYYVMTGDDLIFTPPMEASRLLSISDVYHELGHFMCRRHHAKLALSSAIAGPLAQLAAYAAQQSWPASQIELIEKSAERWDEDWKVEIACDLIAVYWLGPAFVWTNFRLCFARTDVYVGVDSHPADHARQIAMERMLLKMGLAAEQGDIHKAWGEMLALSNETKPATFDIEYPGDVIDALVVAVHAYCVSENLVAYDPKKDTVAALINKAWSEFRQMPNGYAAWEQQALAELEKRFPS